ncbi:MAG: LptF/LptG family permease [Elusimicrobia bacterium]|nr:LptF/LptG family permease [Elusimicrobiota bacterium]
MLKIFDRYMAMRFLKPFLFGLGLFAALIFLVDIFDKMPRLLRSPANLWIILQYLWLEVPYWTIRVIPMATLLATLFAVTGFVQTGEWIAVQASGFETRAFFRPILAMAAVVTLLSFAAQETVLPVCFAHAQRLMRDKINPEWEYDQHNDAILIGRPGQFVTTRIFWVGKGLIEAPVMDYYEKGSVVRQIAAERGVWDDSIRRWVFEHGADRRVWKGRATTEASFDRLVTDLDVPPRELAPQRKSADEMSIRETLQYLRQIRHQGGSIRSARAALHSKLAFPVANIILCALGIPIALKLGRSRKAISFALALAVSFAYLWVTELGQAVGSSGILHPAISAWAANLIFGSAALFLHRKTGDSFS